VRLTYILPLSAFSTLTVDSAICIIEDLMKALDRIPIWNCLGEVPAEVDDLKKLAGC
jgi:hypothetical protein